VYPDDRVARLVTGDFVPVRVHVRDQADEFKRLGERYGVQWTPAILVLDPEGAERHRVEGFLPADELVPQLQLGLGRAAFQRGEWAEAERRFRTVTREYPGAEAAPEALYWAGVARHKATGAPDALADTARAVAERYPDSTWAQKASVWAR
jgi:hypothetical protein